MGSVILLHRSSGQWVTDELHSQVLYLLSSRMCSPIVPHRARGPSKGPVPKTATFVAWLDWPVGGRMNVTFEIYPHQ